MSHALANLHHPPTVLGVMVGEARLASVCARHGIAPPLQAVPQTIPVGGRVVLDELLVAPGP